MFTVKGVKVAALTLFGPALKPGAKGRAAIVFAQGPPPGAPVSVTLPVGVAAALPVQGAITEVARLSQIGGLVSTPLAPSNWSRKELNGTWGRPPYAGSWKTAVNWPVLGLALTSPTRRT